MHYIIDLPLYFEVWFTCSHLSAETSTMSDAERDQIDEEAEKVIHICQESVALIKSKYKDSYLIISSQKLQDSETSNYQCTTYTYVCFIGWSVVTLSNHS